MNTYTGWQYLLIDVANQFGLDKLLFEERIKWAEDNLNQLEQLTEQADNKPLYIKACMAVRRALAGQPIGHLVALDAVCSGIQVMSALTGCHDGARATGLIDTGKRADAYTRLNQEMMQLLGNDTVIPRKDSKDAMMTMFYGSKEKPKEIFGEDTPELTAFYQASQKLAPGAWEILQDLLGSWQPYALHHSWKLPDGFDVKVKVMQKKETRIEVDELDHATFSYVYYENQGSREGISLPANVVHSVDGYILRSMHRRCNYDREMVEQVAYLLGKELALVYGGAQTTGVLPGTKLAYYVEQYERSGMADVVILPYLNQSNVGQLSSQHVIDLDRIVQSMLAHQPFPLVTVHDSFAAHANNMNHVRQHYIDIFAEIAESRLLSDILSQIHGRDVQFRMFSNNLGQAIRGSEYALS